jgi:uncharacterized membrane protein
MIVIISIFIFYRRFFSMDAKLEKNKISTNTVRSRVTTRDISQTGLLTALVFIATYFIQFKLPIFSQGGLVHTGTVVAYIAAVVFGPKKGALAGAFGMGIFDILSGWAIWAPFTFVIRGVMGYMLGKFAYANDKNGENIVYNIIGLVVSGAWMMGGYYLTEVFLYHNWITPIGSLPGDATQLAFALFLGVPIAAVLKKAFKRANII